ncbi:hypothetical protein AJ78_02338 [Emergomyces pasteurianus Ep9510]|uniref:Uncharacterized protein n=1 Tax=Emergomyces pasteurianus Ep9510 TaxID=1447872 RepID=A0A1J9QBF4_9EURO|nr:hypothetical protein AJ78_02338 [Emergomyces pasteurianus Ep9510]
MLKRLIHVVKTPEGVSLKLNGGQVHTKSVLKTIPQCLMATKLFRHVTFDIHTLPTSKLIMRGQIAYLRCYAGTG